VAVSSGDGGFADRLRGILRAKSWTQKQLADRLDVERATVNRWANGHNVPDEPQMERLAATLGVTAEHLRYGRRRDSLPVPSAEPYVQTLPLPFGDRKAVIMHAGWPAEARRYVREVELAAIDRGATEDDLFFIRSALTEPSISVMYEGDRPRQLTDAELLVELRALGDTLLESWLPERIRRREGRRGKAE